MNSIQTTAVQKACELVGGKAALARKLGVQPPTVQQWVDGKRPIPADKCTAIDLLTGGMVSRRELHPRWRDIWPELVCEVRSSADALPQVQI
ncbi:Cro/CI family transcriptional regulator [Caballeronia sp. LZ033]|nr:Cro/CI family transcriptional regulator [Caballeronia sp. LZ033]